MKKPTPPTDAQLQITRRPVLHGYRQVAEHVGVSTATLRGYLPVIVQAEPFALRVTPSGRLTGDRPALDRWIAKRSAELGVPIPADAPKAKSKRGRPPLPGEKARAGNHTVKLSQEEANVIVPAAANEGVGVSTFLRLAGLDRATKKPAKKARR
jgi:hypothetical protein